MKIKTQPDDFVVDEILGAEPLKKGTHRLYLLTKINMNTTDAVDAISRAWKIPAHAIAYGGRKDRHARSTQHITVAFPKKLPETHEEEGYNIRQLGYLDRPMGPDLISANRFGVTVRDLSEEELSQTHQELPKIKEGGYANYFDDQRFGSFDKRMGFFAEKLLKRHENGALKIFLTQTSGSDKRNERDRKAKIWDSWGDWDACLKLSRTDFETAVFRHLRLNPKDFTGTLRRIPRQDLSPLFTAYQAFLWNEVLRRLVADRPAGARRTYPGVAGTYLFADPTPDLTIPMPAARVAIDGTKAKNFYDAVLAENGLRPALFNLKKVRQAFFKATPRKTRVVPRELLTLVAPDEKSPTKQKALLRFVLPRGSYATMLIKRIFSAPS